MKMKCYHYKNGIKKHRFDFVKSSSSDVVAIAKEHRYRLSLRPVTVSSYGTCEVTGQISKTISTLVKTANVKNNTEPRGKVEQRPTRTQRRRWAARRCYSWSPCPRSRRPSSSRDTSPCCRRSPEPAPPAAASASGSGSTRRRPSRRPRTWGRRGGRWSPGRSALVLRRASRPRGRVARR